MKWNIHEIRFKFEPRDCWVGVFWDHRWLSLPARERHQALGFVREQRKAFMLYLCLLPMLPLKIVWLRETESDG